MSSVPGTIIHDHATVLALLDRAAELRTFGAQLLHRGIDAVAHEGDRVVRRVITCFAFPDAVRRVHAHLARVRFEDEPVVIFGYMVPGAHARRNARVACASSE
jgi:hypothetical protein